MTSRTRGEVQIRRRHLLATLGMSAVAGCGTDQQSESPTETEPTTTGTTELEQQTDCVDRTRYEQLQRQHEQLERQHAQLQREHRALRERHRKLQQRVQTAQFPPYIVTDRRSIAVTYKTLNGETRTWEWDSVALESQITSGSIVREMTYSQLEYLGWNSYGFKDNSKYLQLDGYGQFYQYNPFVIPSNFVPISRELYNRHQTNRKRIRAAWNFVTQLNDYVKEIQETPRFPLETLLLGGGDCERFVNPTRQYLV
jgi:hypothetical protein